MMGRYDSQLGMPQEPKDEVLRRSWKKVDVTGGFIQVQVKDPEPGEGHAVPLTFSHELLDLLKNLYQVRSLHRSQVFFIGRASF